MTKKTLDLETLANSFGTTVDDFNEECLLEFEKINKNYRILEGDERDSLILEVLNKIEADTQIIGAPKRTDKWFEGWKENLDDLRDSGYDLESLMPKFIRKNQPIRFMGNYIIPEEEHFEHVYFNVYRTWLFRKFL